MAAMNLASRFEKKMILKEQDAINVDAVILTHPLGFYEKYSARRIENIYFDTPDLEFYSNHLAGLQERFKVRLRSYNDSCQWHLEKKYKVGDQGSKDNYPEVNLPQTTLEFEGRELFPVIRNSYVRRYFESSCGKFRVTLDSNIAYSKPDRVLWQADLDVAGLVEVKFFEANSKNGHAIYESLPWLPVRHSKYVRGVQILS